MKSKEEIWNEKVAGWKLTMTQKGHFNALSAMDVYAEQMAIGFAEWLSKHKLDFQPAFPDGSWIGVNMKNYSSAELFEEYIKSVK